MDDKTSQGVSGYNCKYIFLIDSFKEVHFRYLRITMSLYTKL